MTDQAHDLREQPEEHDGNSPIPLNETSIFSYYRDEVKEAGGLEVKWTVRVADGAEAARLDARQAKAIRELLRWAHRQRSR
jgi:hypothetical protein